MRGRTLGVVLPWRVTIATAPRFSDWTRTTRAALSRVVRLLKDHPIDVLVPVGHPSCALCVAKQRPNCGSTPGSRVPPGGRGAGDGTNVIMGFLAERLELAVCVRWPCNVAGRRGRGGHKGGDPVIIKVAAKVSSTAGWVHVGSSFGRTRGGPRRAIRSASAGRLPYSQ